MALWSYQGISLEKRTHAHNQFRELKVIMQLICRHCIYCFAKKSVRNHLNSWHAFAQQAHHCLHKQATTIPDFTN